jgi:ribonuclease HII
MHPSLVADVVSGSPPLSDTLHFERLYMRQGYGRVAGVDEAGRGPLAGPVVAACVILPPDCDCALYRDSKTLTARRREQLFDLLYASDAVIGVGLAGPREIEQVNILQASLLAMQRAMISCGEQQAPPDFLLVDGTFQVPAAVSQLTLVKGESKSASIAAASIIAKVTRDRLMAEAHAQFPLYGFNRHQGYPTRAHREAIRRHGPCPLHRRTFRGVAEFVGPEDVV